MPINGLVSDWAVLELRIASEGTVTHSGDGVGVGGHSASGNTLYAPDAIALNVGIVAQASAALDSAGVWTWTCFYDGPFAPFGGLTVTGTGDSAEVRVVISGKKLYSKLTGSLWGLQVANVKVYCNGSLELDAGGIDATSTGVGPAYVPLLGIPLSLTGSASAGTADLPAYDDNSEYDYESEAEATQEGGWRFKEVGSDTWVSLPVALPEMEIPSVGECPLGATLATVSIDETWGAQIQSYSRSRSAREYLGIQEAEQNVYLICRDEGRVDLGNYPSECLQPGGGLGTAKRKIFRETNESEGRGGTVRLIANLPHSIKRFQTGYRAFWFRGEMPYVRSAATRSCTVDGVTSSATNTVELYPEQSQIISVVGDTTHAIEDTLAFPTYAPIVLTGSKSYSESYPEFVITGACVCPPEGDFPIPPDGCGDYRCDLVWPDKPDDVSQSESVSFTFPSAVGPATSTQTHAVPLAQYFGHWCNRLWHFYFWRADDEVDGAPAPYVDYWGPKRQQWLYHPALPAPEKRKTRNHLISAPLEQTGHALWLEEFAAGLRWIGVSRWKTQSVTPPSSFLLSAASADAWTSEGADVSFSPTWLVLTPSAAMAVLTLDVGRWDVPPFMLAHICDRLKFTWEATNISAVRAYAVFDDGGEALFRSGLDDHTSAATLYRIPNAPQTKFAGSWIQDAGLGVVTDVGADISPGERSALTFATPEGAFAYRLARGRTMKGIRIEIDFIDEESSANFGYPEFRYGGSHPKVVWESGHAAAMLWADGPGVRWGAWMWYDGSSLNNPPDVAEATYKSTVIDWLIFRRVVLEGVSYTGGSPDLTTELTQLYDEYEGQSVGQVDRDSISFILPKGSGESIRGALVNTFAEVPSLNAFPCRARSTSTWLPTGTFAQEVWDWAQEKSYVVTDGPEAAHLVGPGNDVWTAAEMGMPSGWAASSHTHAVDNDETGFVIRRGRDWAELRPFRGWFALLAYQPPAGRKPAYDVSDSQRHLRAFIDADDRLWVGRAAQSLTWEDTDTGLDAASVAIALDKSSRDQVLLVLAEMAGDVRLYSSTNEGRVLTLADTIASGANPDIVVGNGGFRFLYWLDGTTIKGQVRDRANNVVRSTFSAVSGVDADSHFATDFSVLGGGAFRLVMLVTSGGSITQYTSSDGVAWS